MSTGRILAAAAVAAAAMTLSQGPQAAGTKRAIAVSNAQMRTPIGRSDRTAGYLVVRNAGGEADRLTSATCTCADRVELHTTRMADGVGSMVRAPSITIPAGGQVTLAPGGAHLMFIGLKGGVRPGAEQTVTLTFARAGRVTARFAVTSRIDIPAAAGHAHHGH